MKVFTTGQVAKICKVAPRTVSKWFDSGRLKGYRIPGSQDRRIPREYLIRFMKEYGMPLGELGDDGLTKVLIVSQDEAVVGKLNDWMDESNSFKTSVARSGFECGIQTESFRPACVIVDFSIGNDEALQICHHLRKNACCSVPIIIVILHEGLDIRGLEIDEQFTKPVDSKLVAERVRSLVWSPE